MAQCANTQITACTSTGNFFLGFDEIYQLVNGGITLDTVRIFPSATTYAPGQSFTLLGGTASVQANGISWSGQAAASGNQQLEVCATDNDGQTCCVFNLVFDPNCGVSGGNCTGLTINDGDTITPGQVQTGATAFGNPVVAGLNGTSFSNDSSTSVTVACTGATNGSIDLRMADGTICTVSVNCGTVGGNCIGLMVNDGATITPNQVQQGATAFGNPVVAGVNGTTFSGDSSTSVTVACTGNADGTIDLRMADGSICPVNVSCGTVGGSCLGFTDISQVGADLHTILPTDVHGSETAFASPAIAGENDPSDCILVVNDQTNLVRYQCTGECNGAELTLQMANGDTCPVTINCQDQTTTNLTCVTTAMTVTPGQVIDGAAFATGGTAPYNVTFSTNGLTTVTGGFDLQINNSLSNGQTFSSVVTTQDSTGASVDCTVQFTIQGVVSNCIDTGASTVLATPSPAGPGTTVLINANINPNSGGLPGYSLQVLDFNGNILTNPVNTSGDTWTWAVPTTCQDGTYTVRVMPPAGSNCPQWLSAETFSLAGCSTTGGECDSTLSGDCPATSPTNPQPGDVVTVSLSAALCDCPGFTLTWAAGRVVNGTVVGNPRDIGAINAANPYAPTFVIPSDAQAGEQYGIYPICCPA